MSIVYEGLLVQGKCQYTETRVKLLHCHAMSLKQQYLVIYVLLNTTIVVVYMHITLIAVMIWLLYKEIIKPPVTIFPL